MIILCLYSLNLNMFSIHCNHVFIAINESVNISSVAMAPVCIYMYCVLFFYKGLQTHSLTLVTSNVQLLILSR